MAGTVEGGKRASVTNKKRFGEDFYERIGRLGGSVSRNGGFASETIGSDGLTGKQRARIVGAIGGKNSKRRKV